jgi:hypothetical protein
LECNSARVHNTGCLAIVGRRAAAPPGRTRALERQEAQEAQVARRKRLLLYFKAIKVIDVEIQLLKNSSGI